MAKSPQLSTAHVTRNDNSKGKMSFLVLMLVLVCLCSILGIVGRGMLHHWIVGRGMLHSCSENDELSNSCFVSTAPAIPGASISRRLLGAETRRPGLYHSPDSFFLSYLQMLSKLKIFIYPDPPPDSKYHGFTLFAKSSTDHYAEDIFFKHLLSSTFVTNDPEKADLFLIPLSARRIWESPDQGPSEVPHYFKGYVDELRDANPYWQRTLGADHVIISCHDFCQVNSRTALELHKNSIRIACHPGETTELHPHKDFSMPSLVTWTQHGQAGVHLEGITTAERKHLLFAGNIDSDPALANAFGSWKEDSEFVSVSASSLPSEWRAMSNSKFCLSFEKQDMWNMVDMLQLGCVPVLMSRHPFHYMPFQDIIDWHQVALLVRLEDAGRLRSLLAGVPEPDYKRMQELGMQLSHHLTWNDYPVQYDAFHMVMFELWLRRHTIRYPRRLSLSMA